MEAMLEAKGAVKKFGRVAALQGVDLRLDCGKIMGLLGPNGSGKTTFLKAVAGLLKLDSGEIKVCGGEVGIRTKGLVSYLPDRNCLYPWMKVGDAIEYYDDFYEDFENQKAKELIRFMKLEENLKVKTLSKGMQEKLNLSLVFSRKAKLYILDEPLAGTDPVAREKIIDIIISNFREDSSVLLTTHLVGNIERLFDEVAFIDKGRIVVEGNAEEMRSSRGLSVDEIYREVFRDDQAV